MNTRKQIDVLVVGLGPAGASAAAAAARAGVSVLGLERKQQIGVPVQCAEFIPLPLSKYAQAAGVLTQRIAGMTTRLPSGALQTTELPGLMIDRAAFDQSLARHAQNQGAELCLACRLLRLDVQGAIAYVATPAGEREIAYRVLIAADGPHSVVAASLSLPPLETVYTRQYTVALRQAQRDTKIWLSPEYPGGYAWLFPKGEYANLGLGADKRYTDDLKQPLDALHRDLLTQGVVGEDILALTGGLIPVGGLRTQLLVENILFAGDAAGLTHPITGAGIAAAVASGELAGDAAARYVLDGAASALLDYAEEIREQYAPSLQRGMERRQWLNQYWHSESVREDAPHRKGWIAFPEYFKNSAEADHEYHVR